MILNHLGAHTILLLFSCMSCVIIISDSYDVVTCLGGFDIGNLPTACLPELVKMAKPGKQAFYISIGYTTGIKP